MAEIRVNTTGTLKLFDADDSHSASIKAGTLSADVASITLESAETVFNEDSADIDFRVESNGNANMLVVDGGDDDIRVGTATSFGSNDTGLKINGGLTLGDFTADTGSRQLHFIKSRNTTVGSQTIVNNGDSVGGIFWKADDGNDSTYNNNVAGIEAFVDAAPGTDDTGGRLIFYTTADGARTNSERIRITSAGKVGIGTNDPDMLLDVTGSVSAGGGSDENLQQWNIASDNVKASMEYVDDSGTRGMRFAVDSAHALHLGTEGSSNIYIQAGGQTWINRTTSNQNDHDSGKVERLGVTETSSARNSLYLSNISASFGSYHQRNDATRAANVAYGFFIGSSGNESDNEIRMMGDGSINSDGSNNLGSGADYAEYFEWKDGNSSDEDRRGYSVVLDGNQIVKATDSDDVSKIIGVISGNPSVVGDSAWNKWNQKHLKDDFNTYIWEDYTQTEWTDADGNFISHQTDLIPDGVTAPDDAVVVSKEEDGTTNLQRRKVNPSWDATATYIPRSDRKEWDTVGLMGKLRLKKGQPTGTNWIKMRDISDTVEEWLVR